MVCKPFQTFITFSFIIFTNYVEPKPHFYFKDGTLHLGIPFYGAGTLSDGLNWSNTGGSGTSGIYTRTNINENPCGKDGCQVSNTDEGYITVQSSSVLPSSHGISTSNGQIGGSTSTSYDATQFSSTSSTSSQNEFKQGQTGGQQGSSATFGLMYPTITIEAHQNGYDPSKQTTTNVQTDNKFGSNSNNNGVFISGSSTNTDQSTSGQTDTSAGGYENEVSFGYGGSSISSGVDSTQSQTGSGINDASGFSVSSSGTQQSSTDAGLSGNNKETGFSLSSSGTEQSSDVGTLGYSAGSFDVETSNNNHVRSIGSQTNVNSVSEQDAGIITSSSTIDTGSSGSYPSYSTSYEGSIGSKNYDSQINSGGTQISYSSSNNGNQDNSGLNFGSTDTSPTGYTGSSFNSGYSPDCDFASSQASDSNSDIGTQSQNSAGGSYAIGSRSDFDQTAYDASLHNDGQFSVESESKNHVRSIDTSSSSNNAASEGSSTSMASSSNMYSGHGSIGHYPSLPAVVYQSHGTHGVSTTSDANSGISSGSQYGFTSSSNAVVQNTESQSNVNNAKQNGSSGSFGVSIGSSTSNTQTQVPETSVSRTRINNEPTVAVQTDSRSNLDQTKFSYGSSTQQGQFGPNGVFPLSITIHTHGGYVPPPTTTGVAGVQSGVTSSGTSLDKDNKIDVRFNGNSDRTGVVSSSDAKSNNGFGIAVSDNQGKVGVKNDGTDNFLYPGLSFETHKRNVPSGSSSVNTDNGIYVTASERHHHRNHPGSVVFSLQPANSNGYIGGGVGADPGTNWNTNVGVRHHHRTGIKNTPALVIPFPILTPFMNGVGGISSRNGGTIGGKTSSSSDITGLGLIADTLANGFSFGIN